MQCSPALTNYFLVSFIEQILKELDREVKPNHTLIVKATENCSKQPSNITLPKSPPLSRSYHSALTRTNSQTKLLDFYNRFKHSRSLRSISDENYFDGDMVTDDVDESHDNVHFQSLVSGILNDDNTLVQVIVHVNDINDNAPVFENKVFTGKFEPTVNRIPRLMSVSVRFRWCNHSCGLWNENNVNQSHRS